MTTEGVKLCRVEDEKLRYDAVKDRAPLMRLNECIQ